MLNSLVRKLMTEDRPASIKNRLRHAGFGEAGGGNIAYRDVIELPHDRVRAGSVDKLGEVAVGPNAHTVAVDPGTHEVYFPLRQVGGRPVLRVMRPVDQ